MGFKRFKMRLNSEEDILNSVVRDFEVTGDKTSGLEHVAVVIDDNCAVVVLVLDSFGSKLDIKGEATWEGCFHGGIERPVLLDGGSIARVSESFAFALNFSVRVGEWEVDIGLDS